MILVWDGWVTRARPDNILTLLKPRLHSESANEYNDPINWFVLLKGDSRTDDEILSDHHLVQGEDLYYKVVRNIDYEERLALKIV